MGVGHIYLGRVRRGIIILIIGMIGWGAVFVPLVMLGMLGELEEGSIDETDVTGILAGFGVGMIIFFVGMLALFIWQILNSRKLCKEYNEYFEEHGKPPW